MKYVRAIQDSAAYKTILRDVASGALGHAYMVICGDRELLESFFRLTACAIYCKNGGCLTCLECQRVLHGNHPDTHYIRPAEGKQLKVEDIVPGLVESCLMSAVIKGGRKLYFISGAERMNAPAQNKLLKTLEEPPEDTSIFIGAANEAAILDTVKSRVRKLYINYFDSASLAAELRSEFPGKPGAEEAAAASGGNLTVAERLMSDPEFKEDYEEAFRLFTEFNGSKEVAEYLNKPFMGKDRLQDTLAVMEFIGRDALAYAAGGEVWAVHRKPELKLASERFTPGALTAVLGLIYSAREKLSSNCNAANVADSLLFSILEVKYKCRKS